MKPVTLILTAYGRDYYNYLSIVLKVDPHHSKDYKMCTEVEHIRGIPRDKVIEVIYLIGSPVKNMMDETRIFNLVEAAKLRFEEIKEIAY